MFLTFAQLELLCGKPSLNYSEETLMLRVLMEIGNLLWIGADMMYMHLNCYKFMWRLSTILSYVNP